MNTIEQKVNMLLVNQQTDRIKKEIERVEQKSNDLHSQRENKRKRLEKNRLALNSVKEVIAFLTSPEVLKWSENVRLNNEELLQFENERKFYDNRSDEYCSELEKLHLELDKLQSSVNLTVRDFVQNIGGKLGQHSGKFADLNWSDLKGITEQDLIDFDIPKLHSKALLNKFADELVKRGI